MRALVFLICFLFASSLFAQCPGGTCAKPAQATKSVLNATVKKSLTVKKSTVREVRRVREFRLFRRWR